MSSESQSVEQRYIERGHLPEFVDWILGALIALTGLTLVVAGSALEFLIDREVLAEDIERGDATGQIMSRELSDAELVEFADVFLSWLGVGLLVTGVLLVLFAIGYVIYRHRAHGRAQSGEDIDSYWAFAVLGGVSTALLSFVPLSPILGGMISGYLEWFESDRTVSVGAMAGFLPTLPIIALVIAGSGGLVAGMMAVDEGAIGWFFVAVAVLVIFFVAVFGAGLGALGGYLGGWIADRRQSSNTDIDG